MPDLTALGEMLEQAREARGLSKREAARRANISEGRWRQIVAGYQRAGGVEVPANPRAETVINMANAVGVDVRKALDAAGLKQVALHHEVHLFDSAVATDSVTATVTRADDPVEKLIREIYADEKMPEERKQELVRLIRRAEAQREAELQAAQDELNSWRRRRAAG